MMLKQKLVAKTNTNFDSKSSCSEEVVQQSHSPIRTPPRNHGGSRGVENILGPYGGVEY